MAKSNSVSKNIVVVLTALPKLSWYFLNVTISSTSPIERFSNNNFQRDFRQNWVGNWFHFPCFFWLTLFVFAFLLCHLFLMTELSTFGLHKILMAVVSTQTTTRAKFLEYSNFDETATMNRIISASDNSQEHMTNSLDRRHRELNNPKKNFWISFRRKLTAFRRKYKQSALSIVSADTVTPNIQRGQLRQRSALGKRVTYQKSISSRAFGINFSIRKLHSDSPVTTDKLNEWCDGVCTANVYLNLKHDNLPGTNPKCG